jgi:hypothetical protein
MKTYERKTSIKKSVISKDTCVKLYESAMHEKGNVFKEATGYRREMGKNGALADFSTLKFWNMARSTRKMLEKALGEKVIDNANEVYFLHFDNGCIPPICKWDKTLYTMHAISLFPGQRIRVGDGNFTAEAGDAITFNLNQEYEVPQTNGINTWICCIFLPAGLKKSNI